MLKVNNKKNSNTVLFEISWRLVSTCGKWQHEFPKEGKKENGI